jgi:hypothetical protein
VSEASVELNARYLRSADAVLLVVDPLKMEGGQERAGLPAPPPDGPSDDAFGVLEKITDLLQAGRRGRRVRKPLAVAVTKMDLFWDGMAPEAPLQRPEPMVRGFDQRDGDAVHAQVAELLRDWDGRRIDQFLRENYRRYRYFGLSALGADPRQVRTVPATGIQPYRVGDPVLWLLAQLGALRTVRGR